MRASKIQKVTINLDKFISFHKDRVALLKNLMSQRKKRGRLLFQISLLGIESLARLSYPDEVDSKKRFCDFFLSSSISDIDPYELFEIWRNALTHQGFICAPYTSLEGWDEKDIAFLVFPKNRILSYGKGEFIPETMPSIYNLLIDHFDAESKKEGKDRIRTYALRVPKPK